MSKQKKTQQLGMNPSTASGRLTKDLLFKFLIDAGHKCHQCGEELTRDTFSIEHKKPWIDSEDPASLFFDLDNIAFSHLFCNFSAARRPHKKDLTDEERREEQRKYVLLFDRTTDAKEKRKIRRNKRFIETGKW